MSIIFRPLVEKIGAKLMQTEDAINASKIIVMAVPKDFYVNQPLHLLERKTVIDCSNRSSIHRKNDEQSQAEYLQSLLPKSPVVKAFNVLSAYALESGGLQGENSNCEIRKYDSSIPATHDSFVASAGN